MEAKLSARVENLESSMVRIKQHQYEHDCQIDVLAFEVRQLHDKVDHIERNMVTKKEFNQRIGKVESQLELILDALAIQR
jgi:hypothetical protein